MTNSGRKRETPDFNFRILSRGGRYVSDSEGTERPESEGPLSGIRVLDLGTMVAGPVAATLLGDFGAEVIKVEQPDGGDSVRSNGPACNGSGLWWQVEGRNKRSITVNLREPEGQQIIRKLVEKTDVLIENFRPGTMARWGLGYEALRELNPKLIMLSVSGYGQTGPYAKRAAYDRIALAFGGLLHITGEKDGPPLRPGVAIADYMSAILGAFSVVTALFNRDARGGVGQQIDLALYETVFRFTDVLFTAYDKLGVIRERQGNLHFAAAPGDHYRTADGRYLVITISNDGMFKRLCGAMSQPDLAHDEQFATHSSRWENIEEINARVGEWVIGNSVEYVCSQLDKFGVAHSLVYTAADIAVDPHYSAREAITSVHHPIIGDIKMPSPQPKMTGTPAIKIKAAQELGQDTDSVLESLIGLDSKRVAELKRKGII